MRSLHLCSLAPGGQFVGGVGAHRLGEVIANAGLLGSQGDKRLVDEAGERRHGVGAGHGSDGVKVEAARKDG